MLLLVNINNSTTQIGLHAEDRGIVQRWRIRSEPTRTPDEVGIQLRSLLAVSGAPPAVTAACVASVVPPLTEVFVAAIQEHLGIAAERFRWTPELGVRLDVEEPGQVGADRLANTVAAHLDYPGPVIVVDLGTATTYDVIGADGAFLGGIIAPGIETAAGSLIGRAALLPRVAPGFPEMFIGRSTVTNLQTGIYRGAVVMIDGLVDRIRAEWEAEAEVIATGGLAPLIGPRCSRVDRVDTDLTLRGIAYAYRRLVPSEA